MFSGSSPWRCSIGVAGLVAIVWLACFRFPIVWIVTGIGEANRPFMDLYGILAACDAVRAGVDPFLPNNFDPYHRPHHYSDWWFGLNRLGLGRADTLWLGYTLLAATLVSVVAIVQPRNRREGLFVFLLLVSPAFLLAVNRTNNDLVVLILVSIGLACFRDERGLWRALSIILFAASAVLKYTPLVTLVVLLDLRSRRTFLAGLGLYAAVLVLGWPGLATPLKHLAQFMPVPEWLYAYGAPLLGRDLGVRVAWVWQVPAALLVVWALGCAYGKMTAAEPENSPQDRAAEREFMCGAAMVVGLFFMGSSYVYKLVFAVWLLPWLWRRCADGTIEAGWARATKGLLLGVVWFEGAMAVILNLPTGWFSPTLAQALLKATLVVTQLGTWVLVACLLRVLLIYVVRRSRALLLAG